MNWVKPNKEQSEWANEWNERINEYFRKSRKKKQHEMEIVWEICTNVDEIRRMAVPPSKNGTVHIQYVFTINGTFSNARLRCSSFLFLNYISFTTVIRSITAVKY